MAARMNRRLPSLQIKRTVLDLNFRFLGTDPVYSDLRFKGFRKIS